MRAYVYILRCSDKSYYAGITWNLKKRLTEHQAGLSLFTKSRLPVSLVYCEMAENKSTARRREIVIKDMNRRKKEELIGKFTSSVNEKRR